MTPDTPKASYIVVDFESYYSQDYSLRVMTPPEYILDPRFECIGAATCEGPDGAPVWRDGPALGDYLRGNAHRVFVSHNALFDMCLLRWRFGVSPPLMVDTMGMARATVAAYTTGVSLAKVAQHLGLGVKGDAVMHAKGFTGAMLRANPILWGAYTEYARNDAALCRDIFERLRLLFPRSEIIVNDLIIRMASEPALVADRTVLAEHAAVVAAQKQSLLDRCGLASRELLMSNDKFAAALESLGVPPPTKISKVTGKVTYAFAKTDQAMTDLEDHPDAQVQALVAARLGHKSTQEETRTERFQAIANLDWAQAGMAPCSIPVPLRYSGAHTHRLSGDWSLNMQNLPRGGRLRDALMAPEGYTVVAGDSSQIEARINAVICGQDDLVEDFRNKVDVYSKFAEDEIYHYPVNKNDTPNERFVGKTSILSLGYQSGWRTFQNMIRVQSRSQLGVDLMLYDATAQEIVMAYRRKYWAISGAWKRLQALLPQLAFGDSRGEFGPMTFRHQRVEGPSGLSLYYHDLRQEVIDGQTRWRFTYQGKRKDLYGGKLLENFVQHLAGVANKQAALRIRSWYPEARYVRWVKQVHDELVYVVKDEIAAEFSQALKDSLSFTPDWMPSAPFAAEVKSGKRYGAAK